MLVGITGGTGFVGRSLVSRHLAAGHKVRLLSRRSDKGIPIPDTVNVFDVDITGPAGSLVKFVDGVDTLYHCAGEIREEAKMHAVHVTGTKNLCSAADGKIGHWVQLSSVGAYGPHSSGIVTERTPLNPVGIYEKSKTEADHLVMNAARSAAFSFSILRPSNVYGPAMPNQSLFQMIELINKRLFFFIGNRGASANYIHVDNVVEALVRCGEMAAAKGRIYNLSAHRSIENFVSIIADELHKKIPALRLPETPVRWMAKVCGRLSSFPLTESRVSALTNRSEYSIERIQRELGYVHRVSMEDGLRRMVEAWKQAT
jgi:nucleoside-diphosphate-sugar epimerase